jgi:tripartite-type tricarboxylate transporter receptor subunit TctC
LKSTQALATKPRPSKRDFLRMLSTLGSAAATGNLGLAGDAHAQSFPDKPVRIVLPFAPGNTLDTSMRQVAEEFKKNTGQNLLIDNKPGGSGFIAAQNVLQAAPDGYTLLLNNTSMFAINPHTFSKLPYDPDKSFKSVGGYLGASLVLAVNSSLVPANDLSEFIAWVKSMPGKVSYASFTAGNSSHFAGVILNQRAGLDMVHVPYNGTPPAVQNLVGGQVQAAFVTLLSVKPHVDTGRVKILAISSPQRSALLPQVATFREQGFADLEIYIWSGLSVPAGTPELIVAKLNQEFNKILKSTEIREKWRTWDFEPLPMTPEEFTKFWQSDSKRWAEAVKLSGFKASE